MKPIITEMTLCNPEDGIASEAALIIRIEDEGGGAFLTIEGATSDEVRLNAEEVPAFMAALKIMARACVNLNLKEKTNPTETPNQESKP